MEALSGQETTGGEATSLLALLALLGLAAVLVVGLAVAHALLKRPLLLGLLLVLPALACVHAGTLTLAQPAPPVDGLASSADDLALLAQAQPAPAGGAPSAPPAPGVSGAPGMGVPLSQSQGTQAALPAGPRRTLPYNIVRAEGLGDQCTAYALDRMHETTGLWLASRGHAGEWGRTAREAGWTVGTAPAARAILVMPYAGGHRYVTFAHGAIGRASVHPQYGHVGWVERLDASGNWALLSDQNWNGTGARGVRWVWLKGAPVQFIYSDR
jgi:surface antigen